MPDNTNTVTSNRRANTGSSSFNALSFMMETMLKGNVNTAIPVRVDGCDAPGPDGTAGYVSATPLVCQRGADGEALSPVSLPKLPYLRLQCGTAAIVADPKPGDIGLAVFAQQDCSGVSAGAQEPVQAGSFRSFDMSDGFYIGGFLGRIPDTFVHLDPDKGEITVECPKKIILKAPRVDVEAETEVNLNTPLVNVAGRIAQSGSMGTGGASEFHGGLTNTGGTVRSNGIVLETHTHTGVQSGDSSTGAPK